MEPVYDIKIAEKKNEELVKSIKRSKSQLFMDLGCGTGFQKGYRGEIIPGSLKLMSIFCPKKTRIIAVEKDLDNYMEAVMYFQTDTRIELYREDARNLPLKLKSLLPQSFVNLDLFGLRTYAGPKGNESLEPIIEIIQKAREGQFTIPVPFRGYRKVSGNASFDKFMRVFGETELEGIKRKLEVLTGYHDIKVVCSNYKYFRIEKEVQENMEDIEQFLKNHKAETYEPNHNPDNGVARDVLNYLKYKSNKVILINTEFRDTLEFKEWMSSGRPDIFPCTISGLTTYQRNHAEEFGDIEFRKTTKRIPGLVFQSDKRKQNGKSKRTTAAFCWILETF